MIMSAEEIETMTLREWLERRGGRGAKLSNDLVDRLEDYILQFTTSEARARRADGAFGDQLSNESCRMVVAHCADCSFGEYPAAFDE